MDAALRIIDANINRAREALRVIEDHARFGLDDADAVERAKQCRHTLREVVTMLGADALLEARDIGGDVGRDVKTAGELRRGSSEDVVRAAFARAQEATRAIGEYAKLISGPAAAAAEQLRYRTYELEQRIVLRGALLARFRAVRLYVLVTGELCRGDLLSVAEAAIRGGAGCIQLREKKLDDAELLGRARRMRELTARHGVLFFVNDRPDIARLAGADGVHVGQTDLSVGEVRHIVGGQILVGKSTHTREQFVDALAERPDYLAVGPMFATTTKPQDHIAGPGLLREVRPLTEMPLVAIGGIDAANAREVFDAGADCVAVCAAVIDQRDPESAARAIVGGCPQS
ncbi:MAG: thiamine phosphate synthase [Phycisphaerae bacterium]|nr:thiamine phosphate synthase [Phycisphaerae bacterium]